MNVKFSLQITAICYADEPKFAKFQIDVRDSAASKYIDALIYYNEVCKNPDLYSKI